MKQYKLLGADGKFYMSDEKGTLSGHRPRKIYGRLDCSFASRYFNTGNSDR